MTLYKYQDKNVDVTSHADDAVDEQTWWDDSIQVTGAAKIDAEKRIKHRESNNNSDRTAGLWVNYHCQLQFQLRSHDALTNVRTLKKVKFYFKYFISALKITYILCTIWYLIMHKEWFIFAFTLYFSWWHCLNF